LEHGSAIGLGKSEHVCASALKAAQVVNNYRLDRENRPDRWSDLPALSLVPRAGGRVRPNLRVDRVAGISDDSEPSGTESDAIGGRRSRHVESRKSQEFRKLTPMGLMNGDGDMNDSSLALLEAAGVSIPTNALEQPKQETDLEYAERLVGDASKLLRRGDLLAAANTLESAARYLRGLEAMPR
jgi:hypothetical protein